MREGWKEGGRKEWREGGEGGGPREGGRGGRMEVEKRREGRIEGIGWLKGMDGGREDILNVFR